MEEPAQPPLTDKARQRLRDNLGGLRGRIAEACRQAGRSAESVTLVAVTKYVAADVAKLVLQASVTDLAESRPQVLWDKAAALAEAEPKPRWHLVGHLQRNKIRRTLPLLAMLQSLDSLRLLEAIEAEARRFAEAAKLADARTVAAALPPLEVLVEVNLTDDPGRSGVRPDDVAALVAAAARSPFVRLRGLMGMAARPDSGTDARRDFARLRVLRDSLAGSLSDPSMLTELSMGMSEDFEAAILEGATIVRIGSALFEGL
jgi:pyridoxal phosphate enzyme (YggS family)